LRQLECEIGGIGNDVENVKFENLRPKVQVVLL
jgi:hypothetical protein